MYGFQTTVMKLFIIRPLETIIGKLTHIIKNRNVMMEEETGSCSDLSTLEMMEIAELV